MYYEQKKKEFFYLSMFLNFQNTWDFKVPTGSIVPCNHIKTNTYYVVLRSSDVPSI